MNYANVYRLCKAIATHVEMAVSVQDDSPAKAKLKQEIDSDIIKLKGELENAPNPD